MWIWRISVLPPPKPESGIIHESKLDAYKALIDSWLMADRLAPRKQRHNAKRVFRRLQKETKDFNCSYRLVAMYVSRKKKELQLNGKEGSIPLNHRPGGAQADFGYADSGTLLEKKAELSKQLEVLKQEQKELATVRKNVEIVLNSGEGKEQKKTRERE